MPVIKILYGEQPLWFKVRSQSGVVSQTVSDQIVLREAFTENTYDLQEDQLTDTGIVVDVGANIGAVSVLAAMLHAKWVLAYEPEPDNYALLVANIRFNHLQGIIQPFSQAVWSTARMLPLVTAQAASTSRPDALAAYPQRVIQVPAVTLESILAPYSSVDLLKVDIEGAEYEVLAFADVNRKAKRIVIEFHPTTRDIFGRLLATLSQTHNIQVFGHYDQNGGQILAKRYD